MKQTKELPIPGTVRHYMETVLAKKKAKSPDLSKRVSALESFQKELGSPSSIHLRIERLEQHLIVSNNKI